MAQSVLTCTKCQAELPAGLVGKPDFGRCPACRAPLRVEVFPALLRPPPAAVAPEALVVPDDASCFFHPAKRAAVVCQGCGRFLCALCDVDIGREHLCPACLHTRQTQGKAAELEAGRPLYDGVAMGLAIYPLLVFYVTLITAPAVLFVVVRYWTAPGSLVHSRLRTRVRLGVAAALALLQLAGWTALFVFIASR